MTAREMHYDFKQKINKLDSSKNRNLNTPEIDWKLNEAQEIFVKGIAQPRLGRKYGLEYNQRTIDDIRTIVVNQRESDWMVPVVFDAKSYTISLPSDYWFYANSKVYASKGDCKKVEMKAIIRQHDDEHELSPFDRSSFIWRSVNIRFIDKGIRIFTDGVFTIDGVRLEYLREPRRIHNAQDFQGGTYTVGGIALTGSQDCELPRQVHREIVDLAVLIAAGDIGLQDYQLKQHKTTLTT